MKAGRFYITRYHEGRKQNVSGEWLSGEVDRVDAAEEASALLADPRDTITGVYFWSYKWQQFDGKWIRKEGSR